MKSFGFDGEVAEGIEDVFLGIGRSQHGGALILSFNDHVADFVMAKGVEGEDVA